MKYQVNKNSSSGAVEHLLAQNIWSADSPLEVLNEHLSMLVGRYVPTKVLHVHNQDKCRLGVFDIKWEAHLRWTCDRLLVRPNVRAKF